MPRTGLSPEEIRAKAIGIALDRMRLVGADKLRLTDVAKALDLSHAALYPHFASKAELFDAAVQSWLQGTEVRLAEVAAGPGPARDRIMDWFDALYRHKRDRVLSDPELYRAFNTAMTRETPSALNHVRTLRRQLETLVDEAGIAEDPAWAAGLLFEATAAFHHPSLISHDIETDRAARMAAILGAMLAGLSAGA